ncbi:MAG: tetratricopeptide repeat protein [Fibromonadaceae bacterium]|jgi:tetratricopeptide (TPR) repeat protein|nr:tetratricopeptide repeat protein [Fibromonadaceae bacterium]
MVTNMDNASYDFDSFSALRDECARISLDITEASRLSGEKRAKEYQRLLNEILELRHKDPNNEVFELHSLLGLMYLRTDQQKAAITELQISLKAAEANGGTNNDVAGVWYNMGIAYMELNLFDDAYNCFQSSLALRPHNIKCFTSMAVVKQMQRDFKKSYEILCDVLKYENPQNSDIEKVFISLGYTLFHSKKLTEAMECADKILQQVNSKSEKALKLKGTIFHAQGNFKEAWNCCDILFEQSGDSSEGHLLAGSLASSEKNFRKAFTHYNKARKIGRIYSFTLFNSIATALSKLQKFAIALKVYRYILSIDQNPAHRNSARKSINFFESMAARKLLESMDAANQKDETRLILPAYQAFKEASKVLENGELEKALEMLQEVGELEGADRVWEIENAIGRIHYKMRKFTASIPYFEQAVEKSNNSISVLHNLASALTRNNEQERALEVIDRLLEIQPESQSAKKMRAVILGKLGKYSDSVECLNELLEKEPRDANSLISMGRVWQEKGDYLKAHECFVQLLSKEPENERAVMSIAINYSRAGDLKQAVNFTKTYLNRNPLSFSLNLTMANILRFHKKFNYAEGYYRKCSQNYNREVYEGLADCICQMRRLDEALVYYEKIAEMEKENTYSVSAKKSIAFIYRLKQDYLKALEIYDEINWEQDYFFSSWRNVALCYAALANKQKNAGVAARRGTNYFTKALKLYETIKEREKDNPKHCARIDSLMAELYADKGEYAKACKIYEVAMEGSYYFITWKTYVNCLIMQKLFQKALDVCNSTLEKFSADAKPRKIPEELHSYKEHLELALGGDSLAEERILQVVEEKMKNSTDWMSPEK